MKNASDKSSQGIVYPLNAAELLHIWLSRTQPSTVTGTYLLGVTITVIGAIIRVLAYRALGPDYAFVLSLREDHKLATRGVYSVVRHPAYSGYCLVCVGSVMCQLGSGSFWDSTLEQLAGQRVKYWVGGLYAALQVLPVVAMFPRMRLEDEVLRRAFGKQWEDWAARTRYKLAPYVF